MAAITANLLAATAPPVKPPVSQGVEPTPNSGFADALTDAVKRRDATIATPDAVTPPKPDPSDDTDPTAGTADAQAAIAAAGLLTSALPLIAPPTTTAGTSEVTSLVPEPVPTTQVQPGVPTPTDPQASRAERLRFSTPSASPNTTAVIDLPTGLTSPVTPPTEVPTTNRRQIPGFPQVLSQQPVTVPVATTPAEVVATATRAHPVAPQVPVLTDRGQQLPALPPDMGYGVVNPNVRGPQEVMPIAPAGGGQTPSGNTAAASGAPAATDSTSGSLPGTSQTERGSLQGFQSILSLPNTSQTEQGSLQGFQSILSASGVSVTATQIEPTAKDPSSETSPVSAAVPGIANPLNQQEARAATPDRPPVSTPPAVATQLSDAFVTHARVVENGGVQEFQLRLDPPELGEVKVRVLAMGDRIEARLMVSDDAVKRLIESQLPELRQRLEAAGVSVPKFDVTSGGSGGANAGGGWERPETAPTPTRIATPPRPSPRPLSSGGLIDVTA